LGDKPTIVDFTASWCGPCQRISPILEELAKEYEGQITIYKVDVDKEKGLAHAFNVSSIPAVLYIPLEGEPVMTVGARGKERFKEEIKTLLLKK
jgi:thioredoxin